MPRPSRCTFNLLVEGGRTHRMQFAAGQHGFSMLDASIETFGCTGADHRIRNSSMKRITLSCASVISSARPSAALRTFARYLPRDQRAHIQRDDALVLEAFGHRRARFGWRAFDNGGLADTRVRR